MKENANFKYFTYSRFSFGKTVSRQGIDKKHRHLHTLAQPQPFQHPENYFHYFEPSSYLHKVSVGLVFDSVVSLNQPLDSKDEFELQSVDLLEDLNKLVVSLHTETVHFLPQISWRSGHLVDIKRLWEGLLTYSLSRD